MNAIKAIVRNGRIVTDEPLDQDEGTELLISLSTGSSNHEDGWDNSPEAIAAWLKNYDLFQTLNITAQEEAQAEEWLKKCDEYSTAKMEQGIEDRFQGA